VFTGENPCIGVERYKITRTMPEFHTEEELNALRRAAVNHGIEWVVLLGGWAGLRRGEIVNARWEWFDFNIDKPTIRIKAFGGFTIKDSEERVVPMSRQIYDALSATRKTSGYVFKPDKPSVGHARYRYDPKKALLSSLKDAGLTTKNPFQRLRMTFGSIHVQRGKNIFTVSKWLGHSSVQVTERHYIGIQAYDSDIDSF
jgi:integrase